MPCGKWGFRAETSRLRNVFSFNRPSKLCIPFIRCDSVEDRCGTVVKSSSTEIDTRAADVTVSFAAFRSERGFRLRAALAAPE